jgi:hypothetical protein
MAIPIPTIPVDDDLAPLPMHEEEDVPEGSLHHRWSNYLYNVLRALFSHLFASGNVCIFWDPNDVQKKFVAPDVFLAEGHVPEPPPRSYRAWRLPRIIFAVEIGSVATAERGPKLDRYKEHLQPREVLYTEPVDEEKGERLTLEKVHLHRWTGTRYVEVPHAEDGRVWSEVLESWIGVDEGHNLRVYDRQGMPILNYEELEQARLMAERRMREAEERAQVEARQRAAAEEQAQEAAQQRAAAEERAEEEARGRAAAEERAREAERRLAELLAQLERDRP